MSVLGIDFGNETCKLCIIKKGAVETVLNEASKRKNPTLLSFQGKRRLISEAAQSIAMNNYKNTIVNVKQLLGRTWSEPEVQEEILKQMPNSMNFEKLPNDQIGIKITNFFGDGQTQILTPIEACAMILGKMKDVASTAMERELKDCVVSVPGHWTDSQRTAMLNAIKIAGLNPLSLVNDSTATALDYGIWKNARNLFDEKKPQVNMFVDIGHASSSCTVVSFIKGQLKVLSHTYDRTLGGRLVDDLLTEHFAKEFMTKNKGLDPHSNPKSMMKLSIASERAKCTLTSEGVNLAPYNVEALMEERDFNSKITLEEFDKLLEPALARLEEMITKAKKECQTNDIASVEIVGGSARIRAFKRKIAEVMGVYDKSKSNYGLFTTMDLDESVARGCALRCAMLSPAMRVKEFAIVEYNPYPIRIFWDPLPTDALSAAASDKSDANASSADGGGADSVDVSNKNQILLMDRGLDLPKTRRIRLRRNQDFEVSAEYDISGESLLPPKSSRFIGKFKMSGVGKIAAKKGTIRLDFRVDTSGVLRVDSCSLLDEGETEQLVTKRVKKDAVPPGATVLTPATADAAAAAKDSTAPPAPGADEVDIQVKEMKKTSTKTDLKVDEFLFNALSVGELGELILREQENIGKDRHIKETIDTKNKLEAMIYKVRDDIEGERKAYGTEKEISELKTLVEENESWIYDQGSDETKAVYEKRLTEMSQKLAKIESRFTESQHRTSHVSTFSARVQQYLSIVNSSEEKYAHLDANERQVVRKACEDAENWLHAKLAEQDKLALNVDPVFTASMITEKLNELSKACKPVIDKKPPPKETPKEAAAPTTNNPSASDEKKEDEEQQEGDKNAPPKAEKEKMDLD